MDSATDQQSNPGLVVVIDLQKTYARLMEELKTLAASVILSRFEAQKEEPEPKRLKMLASRVHAIREIAKDAGIDLHPQ